MTDSLSWRGGEGHHKAETSEHRFRQKVWSGETTLLSMRCTYLEGEYILLQTLLKDTSPSNIYLLVYTTLRCLLPWRKAIRKNLKKVHWIPKMYTAKQRAALCLLTQHLPVTWRVMSPFLFQHREHKVALVLNTAKFWHVTSRKWTKVHLYWQICCQTSLLTLLTQMLWRFAPKPLVFCDLCTQLCQTWKNFWRHLPESNSRYNSPHISNTNIVQREYRIAEAIISLVYPQGNVFVW